MGPPISRNNRCVSVVCVIMDNRMKFIDGSKPGGKPHVMPAVDPNIVLLDIVSGHINISKRNP